MSTLTDNEFLLQNIPFIFEGSFTERSSLNALYKAFIKTPEGQKNVRRLIEQNQKITLKIEDLNCCGSYSHVSRCIRLNSAYRENAEGLLVTLRHETDHVLFDLLPSQNNITSIELVFCSYKIQELVAKVNDVTMVYRHGFQNQEVVLISSFSKWVQEALNTLPDTSDKIDKAIDFARTELAKLLWSSGEKVEDVALKKEILNWHDYYMERAFDDLVYKLKRKEKFGLMPISPEESKKKLRQMIQEIELPLDGEFVLNSLFDIYFDTADLGDFFFPLDHGWGVREFCGVNLSGPCIFRMLTLPSGEDMKTFEWDGDCWNGVRFELCSPDFCEFSLYAEGKEVRRACVASDVIMLDFDKNTGQDGTSFSLGEKDIWKRRGDVPVAEIVPPDFMEIANETAREKKKRQYLAEQWQAVRQEVLKDFLAARSVSQTRIQPAWRPCLKKQQADSD